MIPVIAVQVVKAVLAAESDADLVVLSGDMVSGAHLSLVLAVRLPQADSACRALVLLAIEAV